jgi:copper(I)-binding protein
MESTMTHPLSALPRVPALSRPAFRSFEERLGLALFTLALLLVLVHAAAAQSVTQGDITVSNCWSRAVPAGGKVAGGYLTIENHAATPDRLVSATAEIAGKADLHQMSMKDGIMTMRPVEGGLAIPASGKVELKPGAYHLMFTELKRRPKKGESFAGTLTFEKAGTVKVTFSVDAIGAMGPDHGSMKGMKGMDK